jgi:streptomycin 6-kinase
MRQHLNCYKENMDDQKSLDSQSARGRAMAKPWRGIGFVNILSRLNYGVLSNVIAARASDKAEQKGGERISVNLAMRVAATLYRPRSENSGP